MKVVVKIIVGIVILIVVVGIVWGLIYYLPKTEIVVYPLDQNTVVSQTEIDQIRHDLTNVSLDTATSYLKNQAKLRHSEIKNYYNLSSKTAYFSQRILITIGQ